MTNNTNNTNIDKAEILASDVGNGIGTAVVGHFTGGHYTYCNCTARAVKAS